MTRRARNFMEESENKKTIERHWTCCKLIGVHILLPIFIGFCKYLFVYVYLLCTKLDIKQIRNFV